MGYNSAEIAATFGPAVLAGMGIAVSLIPNLPRRSERWLWVVGFVVVGVIVSWANYQELHSSNVLQQKTFEAATGGDNFVYVLPLMSADQPQDDGIPVLRNPGATPMFDVQGTLQKEEPGGSFLFVINRPIVYPGLWPFPQKIRMSEGQYTCIIYARNGQFFESLDIYKAKNGLGTRVRVYKFAGGGSAMRLLLNETKEPTEPTSPPAAPPPIPALPSRPERN